MLLPHAVKHSRSRENMSVRLAITGSRWQHYDARWEGDRSTGGKLGIKSDCRPRARSQAYEITLHGDQRRYQQQHDERRDYQTENDRDRHRNEELRLQARFEQ